MYATTAKKPENRKVEEMCLRFRYGRGGEQLVVDREIQRFHAFHNPFVVFLRAH